MPGAAKSKKVRGGSKGGKLDKNGKPARGPSLTHALVANNIPSYGPGKHPDGRGLYLYVTRKGKRTWHIRVPLNGEMKPTKIGEWPTMTLAQARTVTSNRRDDAFRGIDPRRSRTAVGTTLRHDLEKLEKDMKVKRGWQKAWIDNWWSCVNRLFGPKAANLLNKQTIHITPEDLFLALKDLWGKEGNWTPCQVALDKVSAAIKHAILMQNRSWPEGYINAADTAEAWLGPYETIIKSHPSIKVDDLPRIYKMLWEYRAYKPHPAEPLIFMMQTPCGRVQEYLGAQVREFDLDKGIWTVPGRDDTPWKDGKGRVKTGKTRFIPLLPETVEFLREIIPPNAKPADKVFKATRDFHSKKNSNVSRYTLLKLLDLIAAALHVTLSLPDEDEDRQTEIEARMLADKFDDDVPSVEVDITNHSFRNGFRTFVHDCGFETRFGIAAEICLDHAVLGAVARGYIRGNKMIEDRKAVTRIYVDYLKTGLAPNSDVILLEQEIAMHEAQATELRDKLAAIKACAQHTEKAA